ncbi:hypothetical protein ET495_10205 [Xylanimonas allomyrinae]|uniref:Uncharacterized protein n=1 Tax=Xylanimonas allomyrinae TaxID=2509459 RepID=A0A4P6EZQ1_9MICO|nr:hypothetical protein [Xylanimonas allomyrinae]QAY63558.1 hypothetical protein ET495_10205 [Xylanimonas allomyrinae]
MESQASGLAALVLFVLVLGYWVPRKVRARQELADARSDDRFSDSMRILAVATVGTPAPAAPLPSVGLLTMAASPGPVKVPVPATRSAREETPMAEPQATARTTRLELLELRAKRARRRLTLTLVLLTATAATWAAVSLTPLLWYAGLAPTALLGVVLVLGRAAAATARRADARWVAERRAAERRAVQARALAAGGPRAPRNRARVTGRAVHGSSTMTTMIPRVTVTVVDGEAEEGGTTHAPTAAAHERDSEPQTRAETPAPTRTAAAEGTASERTASEGAAGAGGAWEPRAVPLPTYVTKPAAPRREPRPLTASQPAVSTGWSTSPWRRIENPAEEVGEATTSWSLGQRKRPPWDPRRRQRPHPAPSPPETPQEASTRSRPRSRDPAPRRWDCRSSRSSRGGARRADGRRAIWRIGQVGC